MTPPRLAADSPVHLVLNARSGRGRALEARDLLAAACGAAGRALHVYPIGNGQAPGDAARAAVSAARSAGGMVAVAGGDGTINAVAQAVLGSGCAFGVLPQGTFNYFGRAQGIPSETAAAVASLLSNQPVAVQVGLVGERVFLVNASLGLYASLLEDREVFKSRYGRSRWMAFYAALYTLMHRHRHWTLRLSSGGVESEVRAASLFVGNNALQFEQVGVAEGAALARGELAAVIVRPRGTWSQLGLLVRGAAGRLDAADDVQTLSFRALTVDATRRSRRGVKVAADGEIQRMPMPLHFTVSPQPLWLVKPPPGEPAP